MPYFIIDKESKEFGFFGSLPVMVDKFGLDKSSLEYHFSRKKETKFENEKYEIFKGELERGGSPKQPLTSGRFAPVGRISPNVPSLGLVPSYEKQKF